MLGRGGCVGLLAAPHSCISWGLSVAIHCHTTQLIHARTHTLQYVYTHSLALSKSYLYCIISYYDTNVVYNTLCVTLLQNILEYIEAHNKLNFVSSDILFILSTFVILQLRVYKSTTTTLPTVHVARYNFNHCMHANHVSTTNHTIIISHAAMYLRNMRKHKSNIQSPRMIGKLNYIHTTN